VKRELGFEGIKAWEKGKERDFFFGAEIEGYCMREERLNDFLVGVGKPQLIGVVAQPWRRAEELETLWLCVAPLRLGGLRGKKSTPSVWLGGTGELLRSASRSRSGMASGQLLRRR
jgi:hypothetical protein